MNIFVNGWEMFLFEYLNPRPCFIQASTGVYNIMTNVEKSTPFPKIITYVGKFTLFPFLFLRRVQSHPNEPKTMLDGCKIINFVKRVCVMPF
jgi:hypothetical protein